MTRRRIRPLGQGGLRLLAGALLAWMVVGQGCANVNQLPIDGPREHELAKQVKWAEDELRKGNLLSARTVFDWVHSESRTSSLRERSLFMSGFTVLLDRREPDRWAKAQKIFSSLSQEFPDREYGEISRYLALALWDTASSIAGLEKATLMAHQQAREEESRSDDTDRLIRRQKKELSEKAEEIATLKESISSKDQEIESLKLKIKKLEEIYETIKKKRESLS
jgi:hypothetical protein